MGGRERGLVEIGEWVPLAWLVCHGDRIGFPRVGEQGGVAGVEILLHHYPPGSSNGKTVSAKFPEFSTSALPSWHPQAKRNP